MLRFDVRIVLTVVSLCLPMAVVVPGCVYFFVVHVPDILKKEHMRVLSEYREQARELRANPSIGFEMPRGRGSAWAKDNHLGPGYWGFVAGPDFGCPSIGEIPPKSALVWYIDGKDVCRVRWVDKVEEVDFRMIFLVCGSLLLAVLVGITLIGVRFFVRYAKERDDFVAATAHDLTTPLVAMRRLIGRDDAEAKVLAERMMRLVKNLTDFLRLGGKRPAPELKTVDLRRAYDEAYALFREDYRFQFDGRDVAVEGPEEVMAEADATMAVQILWNLLANDLKYAAPFGPVSVRFSVADATVSVAFLDGGKGLTASERNRIFDRYYRAKSVMKSGKGGFGIGLCTAREFARTMGGDLTVAANAPTGCVFTLTLRRVK